MEEILQQLKKLDVIQDDLKELKDAIQVLPKLFQEVEDLKKENLDQRELIVALEEKVDYLENQSRRDNLIFTGIKERKGETWDECVDEVVNVAKQIGVDLKRDDVVRAHRVGGKKVPRNIVAKFSSWRKKEEILKNKVHLKGSQYFIFEDFSTKTLKERQALFEEARRMWKNGDEARVKFNRLITKTGTFKWNAREFMLEKVASSFDSAGVKRKRGEISSGGSPEQEEKIFRK